MSLSACVCSRRLMAVRASRQVRSCVNAFVHGDMSPSILLSLSTSLTAYKVRCGAGNEPPEQRYTKRERVFAPPAAQWLSAVCPSQHYADGVSAPGHELRCLPRGGCACWARKGVSQLPSGGGTVPGLNTGEAEGTENSRLIERSLRVWFCCVRWPVLALVEVYLLAWQSYGMLQRGASARGTRPFIVFSKRGFIGTYLLCWTQSG